MFANISPRRNLVHTGTNDMVSEVNSVRNNTAGTAGGFT